MADADGLVQVLAEFGDLAARLVAIHLDDGRGRCVVCSSGNQSARAVWPCRLRSVATAALTLQARRVMIRNALPGQRRGPAA